ncbi:nucleotide disphospho-sugar-binding domain-containing protein [Streptomyces rishiriensis]|uniref:nucleotide disphospho-sugar-binding domain-containing protein n=1 Tax=Streptomyces rishiriensis TaxID=68264 RepID=UPI0033C7EDCE
MRLLFTTSNWAGHYFCMIPLGWAAQAAGHEVRVVCAPQQAETIGRAGLVPVPVMESPDMMYMARLHLYANVVEGKVTLPGLPLHPVTAERVGRLGEFDVTAAQKEFGVEYGAAVGESHRRTAQFARAWRPDLVCHDVLAEEGALVADELGVPSVYCAPGLFGTLDEELGLDLALRDLVNNMSRPGVPYWDRESITRVIDPSPDSAVPPLGKAARMPVRFVPYNGPGALPGWTLAPRRRPRVCVVWGRSASGLYGMDVPALREAVTAAAGLGADVVLTAAAEQVRALGTLPDGVRVLENFPLHLLLAASDVVVHHGSDNCLMNAAVAGVPQLALALASDQIVFSRRLAATGAVVPLEGLTAGPAQIRGALAALLDDPALRTAAERLRAETAAAPAPSEVMAELTGAAPLGPSADTADG